MRLAFLLLVLAGVALAGVAGNYKCTAEGPQGAMERTFSFKVDGDKLTGETVSSFAGKSVIENGKVDGDNVTFTITIRFQDNEMKMNYKGKVTGDDIQLTASGGFGGQSIEWKGKRVQ
jgi:hypothetical protein